MLWAIVILDWSRSSSLFSYRRETRKHRWRHLLRSLLPVHLGDSLWGRFHHPSKADSRAHLHCNHRDLTTGLTLQPKNGISLGQQRQKQGCDLASLYLKELWEETKDIDKGDGSDWTLFQLTVISLCHYQWFMQRRTARAWQCCPLNHTVDRKQGVN